jgi:hypothetical protein
MTKEEALGIYLDNNPGCSVEDAARNCYYENEFPYLEKKIKAFQFRLKKGYSETFDKNLHLDLWSAARIAMNRNTWQAMQKVRPGLAAVSTSQFSKAAYKPFSELSPDEELQMIREIIAEGNSKLEKVSSKFRSYRRFAESVAEGQRTIFSLMMRNVV